jgi:hypothetical protein
MKSYFLGSGICVVIIALSLFVPFLSDAQQTDELKIVSAVICRNVSDREPMEAGDSFALSVGKLYCLSNITGIRNPTEIIHAWYYGETQRARVNLRVNPPNWRTYSSKIIQPHEIGAWRVEILDASGNLLETIRFEITK